jgi:splicing factor 3B subunit 3
VNIRVHGPTAAPHLFIGLANGILTRVAMDSVTGLLTDPRSRFLGVRPVKLAPVAVGGGTAVIAMSTRPWVCYNHQGKFQCAPLSYDTLEAAAPFASGGLADGVVGVAGASMRVFALERLGETFNQKILPLRYTPRRMAVHPQVRRDDENVCK